MKFQSIEGLRKEAQQHATAGNFVEAIKCQRAVVDQLTPKDDSYVAQVKMLVAYYFNMKDFEGGLTWMEELRKRAPNDPEVPENLGVMYFILHRFEDAEKAFEKALSLEPNKTNIHDGLAHVYGHLKHLEKSRYHGEQSLLLKDRQANAALAHPIPNEPPPPFDWQDPSKNIIAFSLWGTNQRYMQGMLRNAILARDIYPGWRCRVYCDSSVPDEFLAQLQQHGTQIARMQPPKHYFAGLFWRFAVSDDPSVNRFLVRDADSVINVKERVAVDAWLASDRYFHVMRDFYSHTEVIHAGLWGGVAGVLPPMNKLLAQFNTAQTPTRTYDQVFLREVVWPTVRQNVLIHDSVHSVLGSEDFPPYGQLPPGRHVGQDEWTVQKSARQRAAGQMPGLQT